MASKGNFVEMEKEELMHLWDMDRSGETKRKHMLAQEHIIEDIPDDAESEGDENASENEPDENGYFSIWPDDEDSDSDSDDTDSEKQRPPSEQPENEGQREESEDKPGVKLYAFSEMKRLADRWMKPLRLNMDGMEKLKTGKYEEALELFQQAAEVDSANTNALKHCRYVLRKMNRQTEADDISRRIEETIEQVGSRLVQARSEAELAMAVKAKKWMDDLGIVSGYLVNAIKLAGDKVHPGELEFWRLNLAESFFWWYLCSWTMGVPNTSELLEQAIELFCEVAVSKDADDVTKAQALNELGDFCSSRDANVSPVLKKKVHKFQIFRGSTNPQDYYHEAYLLHSNSVLICVSYGTLLMRSHRLDEAKQIFEKAFAALDPEVKYYHAYAMRGELYVKLYYRDKNTQHLEHAIKDLEFFTKDVHQSYGFGMLGTANYLLIMHDNPIYIDKEDMAPALQAYEVATVLLGYRRNAIAHFHHAECLADFGYFRRAVESSKRAIEHDNPAISKGSKIVISFMKQLLQLYEDERKPDHIMSECVYWMDLICRKYSTHQIRTLLRDLYEIHRPIMTRLYHNLLFNKHEDSAKLFRDLIPDFRPWCPHPPKAYIPPPKLLVPFNIRKKPFDFLILHSDSDKPWVYCSFLTKFELQYKLKGCVIGRDIEADCGSEDALAKVVSSTISAKAPGPVDSGTKNTQDGKVTEEDTHDVTKKPACSSTGQNQEASAATKRTAEEKDEVKKQQSDKNESGAKETMKKKHSTTEERACSDRKPHDQGTSAATDLDKTTQDSDQTSESDESASEETPKKKQDPLGKIIQRKQEGSEGQPVYLHTLVRNPKTLANSACMIVVLTQAFVRGAWFQDDEESGERRPHPKLQELLDKHSDVVVLRWDKNLRCTKFLPTRSGLKIFDCSDLVHWDELVFHIQGCAGKETFRVLQRNELLPITDNFLE